MKKELFRFLQEFTTNVDTINKLIVSSYLTSKNISSVTNVHINSLMIRETDIEFESFQTFNQQFQINSLEKVIEAFEYVISPEDKVVSGAVYTPKEIREYIVDSILLEQDGLEYKTICDPACGCSGFLFTALQKLKVLTKKSYKNIIEDNIFGLDIKDYAVERSKILLTLLAIDNGEDYEEINFNYFVGNALSNSWDKNIEGFSRFDIVLGNPPYVCSRNIDEESKSFLSNWQVSSTGHPDLYIPFFELGMAMLKEGGHLGFITMNSFYKSMNGRALREFFGKEKFKFKVIDFGSHQVFDSNNTYTCICHIQKKVATELLFKSVEQLSELKNIQFTSVPYDVLDNFNGWNLQSTAKINQIESTGKPFGRLFKTSSGVATLKNNVYIFDSIMEDEQFFYINSETPIEKAACKEIINTNKLTKVTDLSQLKKKIIFPYEYDNDSAVLMSEERYMQIYPNAYSYLESNKSLLALRDKGKKKYPEWFAFGRNQSLKKYPYQLFFPHIAEKTPNFIISDEEGLLFHNGLSLLDNDLNKLKFVQRIMSSRLFWFYIKNTSKPYGAGYLSLSKNYIKSFGIYDFSEDEKSWLINETDQQKIDTFIESKYKIVI